ncbi:MAG TPA: tRNA pseudouridine(38-40) synthase TruA [Thermoanaerobaculia bacterium]|nr:tRNA pseudouridine(38-40) synthase TruA [Thermoanaerobaculia bacterium]
MRKQPSPSTPPRATTPSKVVTYRLSIEYEGTRYSGWQEQKNAPTVMGALLRAIGEAAIPVVELGGAGRTDAGVHALAQCAHLRLEQRFDPADLCRALNKRLPRDVHVLGAVLAEPSFHARHDAVARSYLYQISRRRTALAKPWVWWVRDALDVDRVRAGAALLLGRHDFRNFADVEPGGKESTIVEVETVEVIEDGALIVVRIVASHFLWRMVRRLIGTLVQVGAGHVTVEQVAKLLEGRLLGADDPRPAETTAPPSGLFLERVLYPGDPPLGRPTAVVRVQATPTLQAARPDPSRGSEAPARARAPRPGPRRPGPASTPRPGPGRRPPRPGAGNRQRRSDRGRRPAR